jgi:purine-binding chemotaxis protein CheW
MAEQAAVQDASIAQTTQSFSAAGDAGAAGTTQFISFAIGDDHYAVDIMAVREIKDWTAIRHLPNQPDYVRGICSLRGAFIPIIDMRCRFGEGLTEPTPFHVFIIVKIGQQQVGLLADRVSDIIAVDPANIKEVPEVGQTKSRGFLSGLVNMDETTIGLINLDSILVAATEAIEEDTSVPAH